MLTGRKGKDMGFSKNADGIFVKDEVSVSSAFTAKMQDELFAIEDGSWWFQYRAQVLTETAERYLEREVETLDIGGGNGYTTSRMQQVGFRTALLEPSYEACLHARQRGISRCFCSVLGDFEEPIRQGMLLDVLEHIEDDRGFLGTLRTHMPGGGMLLITVPALSVLWSSVDEVGGHFRRYHISELCKLLRSCGFEVVYSTYFFSFLVLPILFVRVGMERMGLLKRRDQCTEEECREIKKSQFQERGGVVGHVLGWFETWERTRLLADKRLPLGSSILCVARKV